METVDILIVGGGAAGISAARAAFEAGAENILIADRGEQPGGVLLQCAHRGFGSDRTGMEYAAQLLQNFPTAIRWEENTEVLSLSQERIAVLSSSERGLYKISFHSLVYAAGCREIPIGSLPIGGTRPRGVYTAGQMQAMMNLDGIHPEGPVVILGSGDMGLVIANQIADAGIPVTIVEQKDGCTGLARNRACVNDGRANLLCGKTIQAVQGTGLLQSVLLSDGQILPCATLLTAVGMVPDQNLIRSLENPPWLHLCGNCSRVHAMIESVVREGIAAGLAAAADLKR